MIITLKLKGENKEDVGNLIWTCKAAEKTKFNIRYNLTFVFIDDDGFAHATDTKRYHKAKINKILEPGYYEIVKLNKKEIQLVKYKNDEVKFINKETLDELLKYDTLFNHKFEIERLEMDDFQTNFFIEKEIILSNIFFNLSIFSNLVFNYKYIFDVFDDVDDSNWSFIKKMQSDDFILLIIKNEKLQRFAVTMPIKIKKE